MPHDPTSSGPPHHDAAVCYCCGRRALALGFGSFGRNLQNDPRYLCASCWMLVEQIRSVTKWDHYEINAIQATIDALGPTIEANGPDLAEWSHQQVTEFVGDVILRFGESIREQVRTKEVPFP